MSILSNNCLVRLGLQRIAENERWIRLIGYASNAPTLDALLKHERLDIMIVDSEIAHDITPFIHKIRTVGSRMRIILFGRLVEGCARQAIDLGVDGLVLKEQPSGVLVAMIDHLMQPRFEVGGGLPKSLAPASTLAPPHGHIPESKLPDGLTKRECEIIRCISQGLSNKDIAYRLYISCSTVRHHVTAIFNKLGISNRQRLIIRAHELGITDLPVKA